MNFTHSKKIEKAKKKTESHLKKRPHWFFRRPGNPSFFSRKMVILGLNSYPRLPRKKQHFYSNFIIVRCVRIEYSCSNILKIIRKCCTYIHNPHNSFVNCFFFIWYFYPPPTNVLCSEATILFFFQETRKSPTLIRLVWKENNLRYFSVEILSY